MPRVPANEQPASPGTPNNKQVCTKCDKTLNSSQYTEIYLRYLKKLKRQEFYRNQITPENAIPGQKHMDEQLGMQEKNRRYSQNHSHTEAENRREVFLNQRAEKAMTWTRKMLKRQAEKKKIAKEKLRNEQNSTQLPSSVDKNSTLANIHIETQTHESENFVVTTTTTTLQNESKKMALEEHEDIKSQGIPRMEENLEHPKQCGDIDSPQLQLCDNLVSESEKEEEEEEEEEKEEEEEEEEEQTNELELNTTFKEKSKANDNSTPQLQGNGETRAEKMKKQR